jgi:hypothetical protein
MSNLIDQVTGWLVANPEWRGPLVTAHAAISGLVLAYILCASVVALAYRGKPRSEWAWERDCTRWLCALPIMLATWPARRLWRAWRGRKAKPVTITIRASDIPATGNGAIHVGTFAGTRGSNDWV